MMEGICVGTFLKAGGIYGKRQRNSCFSGMFAQQNPESALGITSLHELAPHMNNPASLVW